MTTDERIITSVRVFDGAAIDGSDTKQVMADAIKPGVRVAEHLTRNITQLLKKRRKRP